MNRAVCILSPHSLASLMPLWLFLPTVQWRAVPTMRSAIPCRLCMKLKEEEIGKYFLIFSLVAEVQKTLKFYAVIFNGWQLDIPQDHPKVEDATGAGNMWNANGIIFQFTLEISLVFVYDESAHFSVAHVHLLILNNVIKNILNACLSHVNDATF